MARRFRLSANVFLAVVIVVIVAIAGVDSAIETRNLPIIIALVVTVTCVAVFVYVQLKRWLLRRRWLDGIEMQAIDHMAGHEFEEACAEIYRRLGFKVTVTKRTRDQGADLIMEGLDGRVVVQTKRQSGSVGNWAVQEVLAAKGLYKAARAIVITNSIYSPQAVELAKANAVELLDRNNLAALLAKVTRTSA